VTRNAFCDASFYACGGDPLTFGEVVTSQLRRKNLYLLMLSYNNQSYSFKEIKRFHFQKDTRQQ